jgi:excisionase family DNA binding protein
VPTNDTRDRLLTPGEVAALFRVDPKTVTRWAAAGRIPSIRTPGGHRRFPESGVHALLEVGPEPEPEEVPVGGHPDEVAGPLLLPSPLDITITLPPPPITRGF